MVKASILGVTGFTGLEILKLLVRHKDVEIKRLMTRKEDIMDIHSLIKFLPDDTPLKVEETDLDVMIKESDVIFLALPHTVSIKFAKPIIDAGKVVIDLSADFRLSDPEVYEKHYSSAHTETEILKNAVYGLSEVWRDEIKKANLIANPGCYPTSVLLSLYPLLKNNLIEADNILVDSKTGLSGAGRNVSPAKMFFEVHENFKAYKVAVHQHEPEMQQVASSFTKEPVSILFVPHLLPLDRGILSTIYVRRKKGITSKEIYSCFKSTYKDEPFVPIFPLDSFPTLKDVQFTNRCCIGVSGKEDIPNTVIISCIDNLIKGAAGQAVQNMNIRFGLDETESLV